MNKNEKTQSLVEKEQIKDLNTTKSLHLPKNAIIPYQVQICENISDAARIYFGQISGLSVKEGYLWATDEQLAEMKSTSLRNIQRWNQELEAAGFMKRDTKNFPVRKTDGTYFWEKRRKIYLSDVFRSDWINSNNVCGTAKNGGSLEPAKNGGSLEPAKNGGIINTSSKYKSLILQETSEVVVFSSLDVLNISQEDKVRISKERSEEEVAVAIKRCMGWKSRPSDIVGIMTALKNADNWNDRKSPEEEKESNTSYLLSLMGYDNTSIGPTKITVSKKYIEFVSGMKVVVYSVEQKDFIKNIINYFEFLNQSNCDK